MSRLRCLGRHYLAVASIRARVRGLSRHRGSGFGLAILLAVLGAACPSSHPTPSPEAVRVDTPVNGDRVSSPLSVTGLAETGATVDAELLEGDSALGVAQAKAGSDGSFTLSLDYARQGATTRTPGTVLRLSVRQSTPGGRSEATVLELIHGCGVSSHHVELGSALAPLAFFDQGSARGTREFSNYRVGGSLVPVNVWKGIRYGEDTAGPGRWRPPRAATCYPAVLDATVERADCLQPFPANRNQCPPSGSEDCLFLNVFMPDPAVVPPPAGGKYPVMVFFHGGNFEWGYGVEPFHGRNLATWGVVMVSVNYRVGTMGFLAHPEFRGESDAGASGNYGLMDQIESLRWVKQNIDAFMGDPQRVTIFGQSAGGSSVCYHMASPLSAGLFQRAIVHSGAACYTISAANAQQYAEAVVNRVKRIDGLDCAAAPEGAASCLRKASGCALAAINTGSYTPTQGEAPTTYAGVDGYVLKELPLQTFSKGAGNHVAAMIGTNNREEYRIARAVVSPEPTTQAEYDGWCSTTYKAFSTHVCGAYPVSSYGTAIDAIELATSDSKYECRDKRLRRALVGAQAEPVYAFVFAHGAGAATFSAHGDELPFLFGNPEAHGVTFDATDWDEALAMQTYWTQFAAKGDPNAGTLPRWSPWTEGGRVRLVLENDLPSCPGLPNRATCEAASCSWGPNGCGLFAYAYDGGYRDVQCDSVWEPLMPVCGDGRIQVSEECDDGNQDDRDACTSSCTCSARPLVGDAVCSACENSRNSPADCGLDCLKNDAGCALPMRCDVSSATCR